MITIYDIAKNIGCSSATVSKALNNYPDVNAMTRKRILDMAESMGYSPNSQAQALTKNKTWNIGVLFETESEIRNGFTHYFFSQILESFKKYTEERGYDLTFVSQKIGENKVSFLQHVRRRRCDGVIIANYDYKDQNALELIHSKIPVVVIDFDNDTVSSIFSENYEGLKLLTQHLIDLNHHDIVYIHGQLNYVTGERIRGFEDTMNANNCKITEENLVESAYYNRENIADKTRLVLARDKRPTAIIFSDDYAAVLGIKVIQEAGLKVPEDISVVGFDGLELGQMITPHLTTIVQDTRMIGELAAKRLTEIIETKNRTKIDISVGVKLLEGASCKQVKLI